MGEHLYSKKGNEHEQEIWAKAPNLLQSCAIDFPAGQKGLFTSICSCYETLDPQLKPLFKDAAFFFLKRHADTAINVWNRYIATPLVLQQTLTGMRIFTASMLGHFGEGDYID